MKQIERITYMENILDEATLVLDNLSNDINKYLELLPKLNELSEYYEGEWRKDFEADEAGKLPSDLKRGVLSEDAVYNLLSMNDDITTVIEEINKQIHEVTKKNYND